MCGGSANSRCLPSTQNGERCWPIASRPPRATMAARAFSPASPFTQASLAGTPSLVFFGYTFCPDVCPVDARNIGLGLSAVEKSDPALGAKIVPIFISVDPARDTPAVLKSFVANFHPRMVGLTGSAAAIDAVAKEYAVYYKKGEVTPGGGYMVDHARATYLMNPEGKPLALLPQDQTPEAIAAEIKRWVK